MAIEHGSDSQHDYSDRFEDLREQFDDPEEAAKVFKSAISVARYCANQVFVKTNYDRIGQILDELESDPENPRLLDRLGRLGREFENTYTQYRHNSIQQGLERHGQLKRLSENDGDLIMKAAETIFLELTDEIQSLIERYNEHFTGDEYWESREDDETEELSVEGMFRPDYDQWNDRLNP